MRSWSLGCGYLPEPVAREHIAAGHLVVRKTARPSLVARFGYAWRNAPEAQMGLALRWWLEQLPVGAVGGFTNEDDSPQGGEQAVGVAGRHEEGSGAELVSLPYSAFK